MKRLDDPYYDVTAPRAHGLLERDGGHAVYWEEAGAADGLPIVLIHGGPGGSSQPGFRRVCDPNRYRIVQFDQRGCGRSTPTGLLDGNTLQATIEDMEALRSHLGIDQWIVAGGSWGSTVAIAYGEAHPDKCLALFPVSTWLCRRADMDWWFQGVRTIFPELWDAFARQVPEEERHDLRTAYTRRILGGEAGEPGEADRLAINLYLYEEGFMRFVTPIQPPDPARGAAYGRIFAHYAAHDFFLAENELIDKAPAIRHLPICFVTGRYDMCTTPNNAFDIQQALPQAKLVIVPGAGHYPTEERLSLACIEELDKLAAGLDGGGRNA